MNKLVAILLLVLCLFSLAEAKVGMAVSPAGGNWEFSRQGGSLQLTFHNLGDQEIKVKFSVEQEGSKFVTADKTEATIRANDFETLVLTIKPDTSVEFGKQYSLFVYALPVSIAAGQGTSVAMVQGVGSIFTIAFQATGSAPVVYQSTDVEKTRELQAAGKPNYLSLGTIGVSIAVILIAVFIYVRRRRAEEEEVNLGKPPY